MSRNMRCETSFFSLTLFKKHLKRYWPIWAVWLAGWMLAMPVNLWNEVRWYNDPMYVVQRYDQALSATAGIIAVVAPIVAVCVFFHLFKSPAANFIGALPLRREGVFATAFAAGYAMLAVPVLLTGFVTALVEWAPNVVAPAPLLTLMGGCLLQSFFWFSFAVLCCVISGNAVAGVSFYVIFNGVIITMTWLVQTVLQAFLYGFSQFGQRVWDAVAWLTPIFKMNMGDAMIAQGPVATTRMEMLWVYAAVGFLMLLAALGLHHVRKAERAGDLIAFGPIRWVFRVSVTLCGGLAFGMLLLVLLFDGRTPSGMGFALAGCCAVAALVSWFVAEMLLQKSFKVFKDHWKGALIGALCFVVAILAIDRDWIGFTTRVPKAQQVKSATAVFGGDVDPIANDGLVYDQETVAELIALHQYMVDHRKDEDQWSDKDSYYRLEVEYDLGLTRLRRDYSLRCASDSPAAQLCAAAQRSGRPQINTDRESDPVGGYVNVWNAAQEEKGWSADLTPDQAQALWNAFLEDYRAGRYRADPADEEREYANYVELSWLTRNDNTYRRDDRETIYLGKGTTSLNAALEQVRAEVEQDPEFLEKYPDTQAEGLPPDDAAPAAEEVLGGGEETVY